LQERRGGTEGQDCASAYHIAAVRIRLINVNVHSREMGGKIVQLQQRTVRAALLSQFHKFEEKSKNIGTRMARALLSNGSVKKQY
jgi:hypothetical protein